MGEVMNRERVMLLRHAGRNAIQKAATDLRTLADWLNEDRDQRARSGSLASRLSCAGFDPSRPDALRVIADFLDEEAMR